MSDDPSSTMRLRRELARLLELDLREPALTRTELEQRCREAAQSHCFAVCLGGSLVAHAAALLEESPVQIVAAVGFPFGNVDSDVKRFETEAAIDNGAQIIEVVANIGRVRERDSAYVVRELRDVVEAAEERPVGLALPNALLDPSILDWLLPAVAETGIRGLTLMFDTLRQTQANAQRDEKESVEILCKAATLARSTSSGPGGAGIGIKAEVHVSSSSYVAELLRSGAVRFGARDLEGFLALLGEAKVMGADGTR